MLNVAGITKFQYAMFGMISKVCHILGTMYYKAYLKDTETRTVIYYSTIMCVFSTGLKCCFASRWNLLVGVSDVVFLVFTDVVFGCLVLAMNILPCLALFAKITPPGIEGTVFAFLTGTWNMADSVLSPMIGAQINSKFFNVTSTDLSNYPKLCFVQFACSFLGFLILPLIPSSAEI
jgi:MFS-type transporter involved in bile tolerance (Atg22 family)